MTTATAELLPHPGITSDELYLTRDAAKGGCLAPLYDRYYSIFRQGPSAAMGRAFCWGCGDPTTAKILAIGEGPGKHEGNTGIVFSGPAGRVLSSVLKAVGLTRQQDVLLINTITEMKDPAPGQKMESGKPSTEDLYRERERVVAVINTMAARPQGLGALVLLGKYALVQMLDPKRIAFAAANHQEISMDTVNISAFRGWRSDIPDVDVPTYVLQHPSWILRMSDAALQSGREDRQFQSAKRNYAAAWNSIKEVANRG